jgi:anti-sigma regulatory factor (Ser/Thr protein kinase)
VTADPFGTAALRLAVVAAWQGSPTRLREDANLEEDHARGYYRDRVVVELAQNAADAAARAGVPGRLTLRLARRAGAAGAPWVLTAANVGAPLDADGVASLASLRASAKGDAAASTVGRFGVGFAAVRSVADDVDVRSRGGGVRFSLERTRAVLAEHGLADAVAARGGALPVLRLPFPAPATAPAEPDTVVELTLRDDDAVAAVRAQLAAVDDALLLALPALAEVVIETDDGGPARVLADVAARWVVRREAGELAPEDVADLPLEQRRTAWSLVWALPDAGAAAGPAAPTEVLHAPTPTDVRLGFPALLVASFPVDPGRRRVLPGPATARVAAAAGRAYAALLGDVARERGTGVLDLVPQGLPASDVDAAVREAALAALRATPLLPLPAPPDVPGVAPADTAEERGRLVAPEDAAVVAGPVGEDPAVAAVLGAVALPVRLHGVARALGARTVPLADAVDELHLPPERWHAVYAALAPHAADPAVREALAGAPVPLADGRLAHGARGTVLPPDAGADDDLAASARALGVRLVHPQAAHPVLERVGATRLDPLGLLRDAAVRAAALDAAEAVLDSGGEDDDAAADVVDAVLDVARRAHADAPGAELPFWLGELPVATAGGEPAALRETALPGTWAAEALDALEPVADAVVDRYGAETLAAAGAHADLAVYTVADVVTHGPEEDDEPGPDDPAGWLAGWSDYVADLADALGPDVPVGDVTAVADLDAVADDAWPGALARLAADPDARRALLAPVRPGPGARPGAAPAPSYTAWWLRRRLGAPFALHDGVPLLPPAPPEVAGAGLDAEVLRALGGVGALEEAEAGDWSAVLDALPPAGAALPLADALAVWRGLARLAAGLDPAVRPTALDPLPERLPALRVDTATGRTEVTVRDADDLDVAPAPRWAQLRAVVPVPAADAAAVAELLDLPLTEDAAPDDAGAPEEVDPRVRALDPRLPARWWRHDGLTVGGAPVGWWVHDGEVHAASADEAARGMVELLDAPTLAPLLAAALRDPARAADAWAAVAWH